MKLDQEPPSDTEVLDIAALEVFLKGLPSHCCLFRGASKPPLFSFGSALCGSRKFDFLCFLGIYGVFLGFLGVSWRRGVAAGGSIARCASTHDTHRKIGEF